MSAWSIYHNGVQRRQEGRMTLSVKPDRGGFAWIIARGGAVIAGGWAPRSFEARDDADAEAERQGKEARHAST